MAQLLVPLPTAFTDDTATVSEIRMARMVEFFNQRGAAGYVVGSTSGEGQALSISEHKHALDYVKRQAGERPVYAVVRQSTTSATIDLCRWAGESGAAAALVGVPGHTSLTQVEYDGFIKAIKRHGNCPLAVMGQVPPDPELDSMAVVLEIGPLTEPWEPIRMFDRAVSDEFTIKEHVCTPLAVFGEEKMRAMVDDPDGAGKIANALHKYAGGARLGKAVLEHFGVEVGPPRSPLYALDGQGRQLFNRLVEMLEI